MKPLDDKHKFTAPYKGWYNIKYPNGETELNLINLDEYKEYGTGTNITLVEPLDDTNDNDKEK